MIGVTPEVPDEIDCPNCGRHIVVPGRLDVDFKEFDELVQTSQKTLKVDYKVLSTWILGLTTVNFMCYFISSAIDVKIIQGILSVIFLISSIGLFVIGINLLLRSRN